MAVCHWSELTSPDMNSTSAMCWCQRGLQHCRFRQPFGYGPSSQQSWWRWDRWICGAMISCDMLKLSVLFFVTPFFPGQLKTFHMGMDQYLLIPCLGGWTSIYQLFWCELQGYKVLTHCHINPEKIQQTSCHLVGSLVQVTTSPVLAPAWPAWERQSSPSSSHVRSCVEAWSRSSFFRDKYDQHWRTLMSAIQMITDDNWP